MKEVKCEYCGFWTDADKAQCNYCHNTINSEGNWDREDQGTPPSDKSLTYILWTKMIKRINRALRPGKSRKR